MDRRLELDAHFRRIIEHVYFQPPESIQLEYPCIVYNVNNMDSQFGDNRPYRVGTRYRVILIHRNPDNSLKDVLAEFPQCVMDQTYFSNNLNYYAYNLYY